jgi:PAS domain S-box-containing protein
MRESSAPPEWLELAHRNSLRLLKLVNTLLDFSRIEAGRIEASFEPTDLAAFTAELAGVFRSGIERAGLRLRLDCAPLPEPVYVDREMWEKIVFNLLSNALKFTAQGEIEVKLEKMAGESVCLSVRDTGIGIPGDELPRIFERFHRVKTKWARSQEGTGIGLALVQELARFHGGEVKVQSREGQGTTFTVSVPLGFSHLPRERMAAARTLVSTRSGASPFVEEAQRWLPHPPGEPRLFPLLEAKSPGAESPAKADGKDRPPGSRIVLADDNSDMRNYVSRLLTGEGYEVVAVEDGEAALAAVRAQATALVLSDVMMPRLDGFELLGRLRGEPATKSIPIILLSARAGEESRVEGVEAGADDYLVKPFSARELLARVKTHLELARVRREAHEKLSAAHDRLQTVLNSISDGLVVFDKDWRYTYLSEQAARILGRSVDELLGRCVWDIFPKAKGTKFYESHHRAVETGKVVQIEEYYPEPLNKWLECHCYPSDLGLSVYFHDITERKQAEEALQEAHAQLADKAKHLESLVQQRTAKLSETIGDLEAFSYSIAHDMRAPLRSLQGFSSILLSEYEGALDAEGRNYLKRIAIAAGRMDKLIRDVLNYSRVIRNDLPLEKVDVSRLLEGIVETYPGLGHDEVSIKVAKPLPVVLGNEAMLTQVFSNLLGNAVKFVAPGVEPKIEIWAEPEGSRVRLFVKDNGIGIEADQQQKIFDMFQQVEKVPDSTGIGLAIVKKAIERMGGMVGVQSELGHGSTFWVELNLSDAGRE